MIINNISVDTLADVQATANAAQTTATAAQGAASNAQTTANAAMPRSGGTFTGNAVAYSTNRSGVNLRNIYVRGSSGSVATNYIRMDRM